MTAAPLGACGSRPDPGCVANLDGFLKANCTCSRHLPEIEPQPHDVLSSRQTSMF